MHNNSQDRQQQIAQIEYQIHQVETKIIDNSRQLTVQNRLLDSAQHSEAERKKEVENQENALNKAPAQLEIKEIEKNIAVKQATIRVLARRQTETYMNWEREEYDRQIEKVKREQADDQVKITQLTKALQPLQTAVDRAKRAYNTSVQERKNIEGTIAQLETKGRQLQTQKEALQVELQIQQQNQKIQELDEKVQTLTGVRDAAITAINSEAYKVAKKEYAPLVKAMQEQEAHIKHSEQIMDKHIQAFPQNFPKGKPKTLFGEEKAKLNDMQKQLASHQINAYLEISEPQKKLDETKKEQAEAKAKLTELQDTLKKLRAQLPKQVPQAKTTTTKASPVQDAPIQPKPPKEGVDVLIHHMAKAFGRDSISKEEKKLGELRHKVDKLDSQIDKTTTQLKQAHNELESEEKAKASLAKRFNHSSEKLEKATTQTQKNRYREELEGIAADYQKATNRIQDLTKEIQQLDERSDSLQKDLSKTIKERNTSKQNLDKMQKEEEQQKQQAKRQQDKYKQNFRD